MKLKFAFIFCLLVVSLQQSFAHAIWIETNPVAKKAGKHAVSVFFGEYGENERDTVAKWFSDLNEIKLWLVTPDGKKTRLTTSDAGNHLHADFTPEADGIYTLLIYHVVKDLHGKSKIEYNASATVIAGSLSTPNSEAFNTNEVSIFAEKGGNAKLNTPVKLKTFFNNKADIKQSVTIASPEGWEKKVAGSEDGTASFIPIVPGVHMIEVMHNVKEPGTHNGKPFEGTWKIATYCVSVSK